MSIKINVSYKDDGKEKDQSHEARYELQSFTFNANSSLNVEAYGANQVEAKTALLASLLEIKAEIESLLKSGMPAECTITKEYNETIS